MSRNGLIVLNRDALYERVWTTPVSRLAQEFGISDVALGRLCRRRNIPLPPRGHWARAMAGQPVARTPLPPPLERHDRPAVFRAPALLKTPEVPERRVKRKSAGDTELHPIADRLRKSLLLSRPNACGRVRVALPGLPLVIASPGQATKVAQLVHTLIAEAGRKRIDLAAVDNRANSLVFRRGERCVHVAIEEELRAALVPAGERPPTPSGRLTFQLSIEWRQSAETPPENILDALLARMDEILA